MKLNWGTSIAIFMFAFIIFILSFVYKAFTNEKYDHFLVSEEYYKDDMNFQKEIDAMANVKMLKTNVILKNTSDGIYIIFPSKISNIKGTIKLHRPSTDKTDVNLPIKLVNNEMLIPNSSLINGLYNVKIDWSANNIKYLYKDKHFY